MKYNKMHKVNNNLREDVLKELKIQETFLDKEVLHFKDTDQRKQDSFQKTVLAIQNIVNRKLYKACAPSLEIYFRDNWKISRAQVYRFLDCAIIINTLKEFKDCPTKERVCRLLKKFGKSPTNIKNLWALTKKKASNREITSTLISKCWEEIVNDGKVVNEDPLPKKKGGKSKKLITKNKSNIAIITTATTKAIAAIATTTTNINTKTIKATNTVITNVKTKATKKATINTNIKTTIPLLNSKQKIKKLKTHPKINTPFSSKIKSTFDSPSVIPIVKSIKQLGNPMNTPLMNTAPYANLTTKPSLNTTITHNNTTEKYYPKINNQKMMLQSLPTPTMSSSKSLSNIENQVFNGITDMDIHLSNMNMNIPNAINNQILPTVSSNKQNEEKIISSYPSPTANQIISQHQHQQIINYDYIQRQQQQQQNYSQIQQQSQAEYTQIQQQYSPSTQFVVEQDISSIPVQMGSIMVNQSPINTPIVNSAILEALPQPSQQIIINDQNGNVVISSDGYQQTPLQENAPSNGYQQSPLQNNSLSNGYQQSPLQNNSLSNGYQQSPLQNNSLSNGYQKSSLQDSTPLNGYQQIPLQYNDSSNVNIQLTNQSYNPSQVISNQGCILSPTLQQTQQLSFQEIIPNNFSQMDSYQENQPHTPQSVLINNSSNIMDSNGIYYYQPTPPKNVLYQTLPKPLSMNSMPVVYTMSPISTQNGMLSPPSQSPVNYYNVTPEFQNDVNL